MRVLLAALAMSVMFATPRLAVCDEKTEAKKHFDVGLSLMKADDFDGAAAEFRQSVKMFPTKTGLFNLANAYKGLHRYAESLITLELLNGEFGDELGEELKAAAGTLQDEIEALIVHLTIIVNKPGAIIKVDDEQVGRSPMSAPLALGPGVHRISAELTGYKTVRRKVSLVSKRQERVELKFVEDDSVAVAPVVKEDEETNKEEDEEALPEEKEDEVEQDEKRSGLSPAPLIIAGGVTAAFGITTIILDVKTIEKFDSADNSGLKADRDSAEGLQAAERVFFGLTLAAAVTSGVLFFLTDFGGEEESPQEVALDLVTPVVFDGGGGFAFSGRF